MFSQSSLSASSSNMLSFKLLLLLISTGVLSAAFVLKSSAPAVADFAVSDLPSICSGVVSWFKPPYLYLIINCIILAIFACSKLQSLKEETSAPVANWTDSGVVAKPKNDVSIYMEYPAPVEYKYDAVVSNASEGYGVGMKTGAELDSRVETETTSLVVYSAEDAASNKENESAISKYYWNTEGSKELTEYSSPNVKPPASARFGHRRNMKSSPEGGRAVLGVSKTKRQDTLETTWKTITEGRAMPLTRHLRKSDTWERDGSSHVRTREQLQEKTPQKMMTKAETFSHRTNTRSPSPGGSSSGGGSGKLRRDPSLSQDDLNRRVEAFIRKFNEEMRLQRQESLNQQLEMVKRG